MAKSDVISDITQTTHEAEARLDELIAPIQFQELLELAEDVCLSQKPDYTEECEPTGQAIIVSNLGTRAIKAALELQLGLVSMSKSSDHLSDYQDETKRPIMLDTPIRLPERFSGSVDFSLLSKARAFGSQLMAESLRIIGNDVDHKIKEFRNATTTKDQLDVINWLDERLRKIAHKRYTASDRDEEDEDEPFYHPMRLSPKIIDVYPNNKLSPTCLGVSIIASSFFKEAGADILHADVARTGREIDQINICMFIDTLFNDLGGKFGLSLPEDVNKSLKNILGQHH